MSHSPKQKNGCNQTHRRGVYFSVLWGFLGGGGRVKGEEILFCSEKVVSFMCCKELPQAFLRASPYHTITCRHT